MLLTGGTKFEELWGRDTAYAIDALSPEHDHVARSTLTAFFDNQRNDGLLPRKISSLGNLERNVRAGMRKRNLFIGHPDLRIAPEYRAAGHLLPGNAGETKDTNPLLVAAAARYVARSDDGAFFERVFPAIRRALLYTSCHCTENLLVQGRREDWADHTNREGVVFYTNLLRQRAYADLAALGSKGYIDGRTGALCDRQEKDIAGRLHDAFWSEEDGHFHNFILPSGVRHTEFSVPENMLAITTGLATPAQEERIIERLRAAVGAYGYAPVVTPGYDDDMIPLTRRVFVNRYNRGDVLLPWIQCLAAEAAWRIDPWLSHELLSHVAEGIIAHDSCLEAMVMEERGREYDEEQRAPEPLPMFLTDIDRKFTWTASRYRIAYKKMREITADKDICEEDAEDTLAALAQL